MCREYPSPFLRAQTPRRWAPSPSAPSPVARSPGRRRSNRQRRAWLRICRRRAAPVWPLHVLTRNRPFRRALIASGKRLRRCAWAREIGWRLKPRLSVVLARSGVPPPSWAADLSPRITPLVERVAGLAAASEDAGGTILAWSPPVIGWHSIGNSR